MITKDERANIGYAGVLNPLPTYLAKDVDLENLEFVPWKGRILVQVFPRDEMTPHGLHLPDESRQEKNYGKVVKLPPVGAPEGIDLGDIVMFIEDSPVNVPALGENLVLLDYRDDFEGDILGVFKPKR